MFENTRGQFDAGIRLLPQPDYRHAKEHRDHTPCNQLA